MIYPNDFGDPLTFSLVSQTSMGSIAIRFGTVIHGPQRMICNILDSLTFDLASSSGQNCYLFQTKYLQS